MNNPLRVGVDVGGTKVAVLVVDAANKVLSTHTAPTDLRNPEHTLHGIANAIRQGVAQAGATLAEVQAVGLGIPGQVEPATGIVRHAVNLNWSAMPVGSRLRAELGVRCSVENDVRAAALGLQHYGAAAPPLHFAYLSIGTGIAAGIILNGQLHRGGHGMAGEVGHACIDPNGPRCGCGAYGCLEALAAGPAIAKLAQQAHLARNGHAPTAVDVYRLAAAGDPAAQRIAQQVGDAVALAIKNLVMAFDLERVIVGGGVARAGAAFWQPVLAALQTQRHTSPLLRELLPPTLAQLLPADYDAGCWGAVAVTAG